MNKRIKELRKELKLTQQAFADALNISKSTVEAYEYRDVTVTERTISDICRIFHVNENWIRTGKGDMFSAPTREGEIAEITARMFRAEDTDLRYNLMRLINLVDDDELESLFNAAKKWVDSVESN